MKKLSLLLFTAFLIACGSDDNELNPSQEKVNFTKKEVTLKPGESITLNTDKPINECHFSVKDDFYANITVKGQNLNLESRKVGETEVYVTYKGVRDTCIVKITAKTSYFQESILKLGVLKDAIKEWMKKYQRYENISGFLGLAYQYSYSSDIYYSFDKNNKVVAYKIVYKSNAISTKDILFSLEERYDFKSSLDNVYWYEKSGEIVVRVEKTATGTTVTFAADVNIMMEYFPWK